MEIVQGQLPLTRCACANELTVPAREIAAGKIAREPYHSGGDDFVVDKVKPDRLGPIGILEVTAHCVANGVSELVEVVRLGENRRPDGARRVPALSGFLNDQ